MKLVYFKPWRVLLAYAVAFRVLLSYLLLLRLRRWYSQARFEQRMQKLHVRSALRIKRTIIRLNGLFIKVGQLISSMGKLLPEEYRVLLEDLQDRVPGRPYDEIRTRIRQELGQLPEELFAEINPVPVASASIAQVHKARLKTGEWVAVKVKHGHIDRVAEIDLAIIHRLTRIGSRWFRIEGMEHLSTQISAMVRRELDFQQERQAQERLRALMQHDQNMMIPAIFPAYSASSVLTSVWIDGTKVSNVDKLVAQGINPTEVMEHILRAFCSMIFRHGYYHADPHPGNLLVTAEGGIVLLDFGAVGEVSEAFRAGIPVMIEAAIADDVDTLIVQGRELGFLAEGASEEAVAREAFVAIRTFLIDEMQVSDLNFQEVDIDPFNNSLIDLVKRMGMRKVASAFRIPQDWVLLNRTTTLLAGLSATLDPGLNPLTVVRSYLRRYLFVHDRKSALRILSSIVRNKARETAGRYLHQLQAIRRSAVAAVVSGMSVIGNWLGELTMNN